MGSPVWIYIAGNGCMVCGGRDPHQHNTTPGDGFGPAEPISQLPIPVRRGSDDPSDE